MSRKMKDSGVEWIGEIPEDWEVNKISQIYRVRSEKVNDIDYQPLSVTMKGVVEQLDNVAKSKDHDNRKLVCKGDFVINSRSDRRGSCGIASTSGSVSLINTVLEPREKMNPFFYNWLFHNSMFSDEYYKWGHGIVDDLWTTNWNDMKHIIIPEPPILEQQKIANFLDEKVGEIDTIIEKTKESIEEYKKYKQAVITETVTKGLNPNAEMKDSGIEWIGKIPKDWDVRKLKYACVNRKEKYSREFGELDYFGLENIVSQSGKYIETSNEYELEQSQLCMENDVVFGKLRPYLAKVYLVDKNRCCSSEFAVFTNFDGIALFYKYVFLSYGFIKIVNASTYGTKMPRANIDFINNMFISVPEIKKQQEIAEYLDKKCDEIDVLIAKKKTFVTEMETYKKSLIYEYVTGKKEVL